MATPRYEVVVSKNATEDLARLHAFILEFSPSGANAVVEQIVAAISDLATLPKIFPLMRLAGIKPVRSRPVGNYRLMYRVYDETRTVRIVRILDGRARVSAEVKETLRTDAGES